jgi:hypothetical protein
VKRAQNISVIAVALLSAASGAACSGGVSALTPTGPSSVAVAGVSRTAFDTLSLSGSPMRAARGPGNADRKGGGAGPEDTSVGDERVENTGRGSANRREDTNRVEVAGRVTAVDPAAGTFEVDGRLVTLSPATIIRHGARMLTVDDIGIGDKVEVKGDVDLTGVLATEVKLQQRKGRDDSVEEPTEEPVEEPVTEPGTVPAAGAPATTTP